MKYINRNIALLVTLIGKSTSLCYGANVDEKPNVIVICADQWRRMAIEYYNAERFRNTFNQGDPVITPHIDKVISEGMIFNNAVAASPISSPNRATLLTGLYPHSHKLVDNTNYHLFDLDNKTFAHEFLQGGYTTAHIGKWHVSTAKNENFCKNELEKRGFEYWYGSPNVDHAHFDASYYHSPQEIDGLGEYTKDGKKLPNPFIPTIHYQSDSLKIQESWVGDHLTRKALDYLKNTYNVREENKPFVLCISYNTPHTIHGNKPVAGEQYSWRIAGSSGNTYGAIQKGGRAEYRAPIKFEKLYRKPLPARPNVPNHHYSRTEALPGYFGAITSLDECIGKLDEYLEYTDDPRFPGKKLKETTIVIITSDHGDMMGSQGRMTKGVPFEESIGVPLIVRWPDKIKSGSEENMVISSTDIAPTLLGLVNLKFSNKIDGKDYSSILLGKKTKSTDECKYIAQRNWRAVRAMNDIYIAEFAPDGKPTALKYYDLLTDPFEESPIMVMDGTVDEKYKKRIHVLHAELMSYVNKYDKKHRLFPLGK